MDFMLAARKLGGMSDTPQPVLIARLGSLRVFRCAGRAGQASAELRAGWMTVWSGNAERITTAQFAVVWFLRGSGVLSDAAGQSWPLRPGTVFQRIPGKELRMRCTGPAQWCYLAVPGAMYTALLGLGPAAGAHVFQVPPEAGLLRRWRHAARFLRSCPESALPVAAAGLFAIAAELHQRAAAKQADPWADLACRLLAGTAHSESLTAVATELGLSPSGFRSRFVRAVGRSPRAWLQQRRMARAQELLAVPGATVGGVAEALGYADAPAFGKAFRALVGISPAAWRQRSA